MPSCDEKTQIQASHRTQPGLPMKRGRNATMPHDYQRNGVTTLLAALNVLYVLYVLYVLTPPAHSSRARKFEIS